MAGANPLIQVHNTLHSLQSSPYTPSLVPHPPHMPQPPFLAFSPVLHQFSTIRPAPPMMETKHSNFNMHLSQAATRPAFAPVTAFRRAPKKSLRTKQGRWAALHVCIAWKIYYQQQLKKFSLQGELTPEYPSAVSLQDSVQLKQSEQPSCVQDSPCGQSAFTNKGDGGESGETSDLSTSPTASYHGHTTEREKQEQPAKLHRLAKPDEKEEHTEHQNDTTKDLPLRDKSLDRTVTPEPNGRHGGSLDRKRQLEDDGIAQVKRVKQEIVDDWFGSSKTLHTDPSPFSTPHTHPSSHTAPVPHINRSDLSVLYAESNRWNVSSTPGAPISYPGAEIYPHLIASWEPTWNVHKRKDLHTIQNDYSLNTYKEIRMPLVVQRQKEAFHGFSTPPFYSPLACRQQETSYLRGGGFLHLCHKNDHLHYCRQQLPHPGFLETCYLGR